MTTAAPCTHHLWDDPTASVCVNTKPHTGNGHGCIHEAANGSWVADCAKEEL